MVVNEVDYSDIIVGCQLSDSSMNSSILFFLVVVRMHMVVITRTRGPTYEDMAG